MWQEVVGAVLGAGADMYASRNNRRTAEKANELTREMAEKRRQDIIKYGEDAMKYFDPAYGAQRDVLSQAMDTLPEYYTRTAVPQMQMGEDASIRAQNALLSGLGMQTSSLLGNAYSGPRLQAQGSGVDIGVAGREN